MAPGTQYLSVLAILPEYRGRGTGTKLLELADEIGGNRTKSLIVSDGNPSAYRLYRRFGYRRHAERAMMKEDWKVDGENWVLMLK